ncbi:MAG: hypothetical protein ACOCV2_02605 [Persicimonas sp.]
MRVTGNILSGGLVALIVALGLLSSSTAFAQEDVIDLEESTIEGRIQKPEAFYILQHAELDYEPFDQRKTFIPELLDTVEAEPF